MIVRYIAHSSHALHVSERTLFVIFGLWCWASMLVNFFKKLGETKWLPWVATAPLILLAIVIVYRGEVTSGIVILVYFFSMWVGIILGGFLAHFVSSRFLRTSEDINKRMAAGGRVFGFLFLPALVYSFANANLGTSIEMPSLGTHFLWSCVAAGIAFCVGPDKPTDGS